VVHELMQKKTIVKVATICFHFVAFHDTDILARIVTRMSACRSACHGNNFRKSRVSDVSARILARKSASVSASWNASLM